MAITNFIPSIWSARLTQHFFANSVFAARTNREYEGDASMGNQVRIFTLDPDSVTVRDYVRTSDIAAPEVLDTTTQTLTIDQEKYFNFLVEDLDAAQTRAPLIDAATANAGRRMALAADSYVASLLTSVADSAWGHRDDKGATVGFDLNFTSELKRFALEQNMPLSAFSVVMPPALYEQLDTDILGAEYGAPLQSNRALSNTGEADAQMGNGYVGQYNGVDMYVSNQGGLTTGTGNGLRHRVWGWAQTDLAFIQQVNSVEAYRPERRFADAVKGLMNYGARVLNAGRMTEFLFRV